MANNTTVSVVIEWLDDCPKCGHKQAIVSGTRTSSTRLYTGDYVECLRCGNEGEIDADGENAWVEWGC